MSSFCCPTEQNLPKEYITMLIVTEELAEMEKLHRSYPGKRLVQPEGQGHEKLLWYGFPKPSFQIEPLH